MLHALGVWLGLVKVSMESQLEYRGSLALSSIGQFAITITDFAAMALLFARFGGFAGWTIREAALLYGFANACFAIADALTWGFSELGALVRSGDFDRYLLRPCPVLVQLLGKELTLRRAGRLAQALLVFAWGLSGVRLEPAFLPFLLPAAMAGIAVFISAFVLQGAFTFVTIEGIEIVNSITYGGVTAIQYPLVGYRRLIRIVFLAVVPAGAVIYLPVCAILGKPPFPGWPSWIGLVSPIAAFPFALAAGIAWRAGLRRYASAGG